MKIPFYTPAPKRDLRQPEPAKVPTLPHSSLAAMYKAARMGGDFYDFVMTPAGRLVFLLADIAGRRAEALHIAAATQEVFRKKVEENFSGEYINEHDAMTDLLIDVNRAIMTAAEGVRNSPAFIGCYEERLGTLAYINAGHPPALLRDSTGITRLPANGFPLGLFSHAAHDTQLSVLQPGAALLVASKGLVESRHKSKEYGMERLAEVLEATSFADAHDLCRLILQSVEEFTNHRGKPGVVENDITALALVRAATAMSASA
ncbi:MAG TPA: SpoIIE family protein phosphatase [Terriglobales bacterium]|nr:SpoIIE family protein phosphatase [Terriglobales bacterium]